MPPVADGWDRPNGRPMNPRALAVAETPAHACCRSQRIAAAADVLYRRLKPATLDCNKVQWPRAHAALVAQTARHPVGPCSTPLRSCCPGSQRALRAPEVDADEYLRLARRLMIRYPGSRLWRCRRWTRQSGANFAMYSVSVAATSGSLMGPPAGPDASSRLRSGGLG